MADRKSDCGLILLGNVGVGKSFLANAVLGEKNFRSAIAVRGVTVATSFKETQIENSRFTVFDVPGLIEADQAAIDRNKQEIYKAFEKEPNSVIGFVFNTFGGGRLRNEDVIAFNALHEAYNFHGDSLIAILNGVPADSEPNYIGEMILLIQRLVKVPVGTRFCFLPQIKQDDDAQFEKLRKDVMQAIVDRRASRHVKLHDIVLEAKEIKELQAKICQQREELQKLMGSMQAEIDQRQQEFNKYKDETAKKLKEAEDYGSNMRRMLVTGLVGAGLATSDPLFIGLAYAVMNGSSIASLAKSFTPGADADT